MPTRIKRLRLVDFQQFANLDLDFTDPDGEVCNRVCFIGPNGTGKTTLLDLLARHAAFQPATGPGRQGLELRNERGSLVHTQFHLTGERKPFSRWFVDTPASRLFDVLAAEDLDQTRRAGALLDFVPLRNMSGTESWRPDLVVRSPAEAVRNESMQVEDVPQTTVDAALSLGAQLAVDHLVSTATVAEMWRVLVWTVKRREAERQDFETRAENLEKTKKQLIAEFDALFPDPLIEIANLWDQILAPAGLEFDRENARLPVQLNDNLVAYIRLKRTGERIPYASLSTGIRNFLFRVGHIFLLYFHRRIDSAYVFVDEPENSLFPDFLLDLVELYDRLVGPNTQLFVATHNPIVAAQFAPHERIVLTWNDDATVSAHRGTAPKGDDPNDVLRQDFGLPDVMGPEGRRQWDAYVDLKNRIRAEQDPERRRELLESAAAIGRAYRFET